MLRNRSKFSQSSHRNARKRNRRSTDQSSESSSSSDDSESSFLDYSSGETLFSDCSDSPFEDESVSPVIGRNLKSRRKRLNAKSKRSNRVIHNRNRNIRSKKKTPRTTDSQAPGPSKINNSSRRSRLENSNTRIAKRKYKDRRVDLESSSSAVCNTSSEEYEGPLFRIRKKRLRYAISNTSESDDSVIQTASSRRRNLLNSESSTSASDEITTNGVRSTRNGGPSLWSDANSDSMEFNSQETSAGESGSSINQNIRRRRRSVGYVGTSDSNGSFSSPFSNSLYSIDSEVANISSVPDSEASSLYNTAKSTSSNHGERNSKDQTSDSDSSDSDGEKCAICLKKFRNQLIGNPSNCDHNFCAPCLKKWSESSTTCPVDRSTFDSITIRSIINGPVVDKLKVENRNFGVFPPLDIDEVLLNDAINDAINCEICDSGDDEETLLLCDLCNLGYHMACLRPPLSAIPAGAWYCPQCVNFRIDPTQNVNEGLRFFPDSPMRPLYLLSSARRPNRIRTNNSRSRPNGPLPRGRGPTRGFRSQNLSNSRLHNLSNAIESVIANLNAETSSQNRRRRKQKNRPVTGSSAMQQLIMAENLETTSDAISRITRNVNQRMSSRNSGSIHRPRGPREVVDMVFPSFSLFGTDELDYFSDEQGEHDVEGEVAIMARVRSEYSARRLENRKNIVTSLNNYHDRSRPASAVNEITENASSVNLLDTILESQALWHSRNVEIKSKKDGTLEIKIKDEQNKKPDLTNTNHSSKEIPLFPNKGDGASDNKSYSNSNNRYSSLGNSSGGSSNSFTSSTSSFNSLNPSTRPGFSNLLGNNSSALDLSPFRGAAPIRFRMNPPRPMMRRQNYNSNSQRPPSSSPANLMNSVQSPKKSSTVGNADEDVDLYDDIETENVENEKSQEMFASLEPPPEPPALLIGSDSSSDDENNGLVIDDKAVHKSNIYDPNEPNEDSDTENTQDKNSNMVPGYLRSPSYGGLSEFGPHLPLPEPPAPALELRMELESVKDSDEEEEAECPNMTLYSNTSINLANNVQDIPIPDAAYPQDVLECIPIPTSALDSSVTKDDAATKTDSELYSPTDKNDSETSSIAEVQITSPEKIPPKRRDSFEIRSISSRDSSRERGDRSSTEGSDRSNSYEKVGKRSSRRRSKDNVRRRRRNVNNVSAIDLVQRDKPSKKIDLTEVDSNDEKNQTQSDDESVDDSKTATEETNDGCNVSEVSVGKDGEDEAEKSDDEKKADDKSVTDAASVKSANEDYKTASEDEDNESEKVTANETDKEKTAEGSVVDTSLEAENVDTVADNDDANATTNDVNASGNYLLPSEDLDPVSDVEYNDFSECQRTLSNRDKRKKRKKTRRRDSSTDNKTAAEAKELEEGEIEEEKSKRKYSSQKKKDRSETPERSPDRRLKKKRDRKEKTNGKENKETGAGGKATGGAGGAAGEDLQWKKLSKNTKERNYRDGKTKPNDKLDKAKDREIKGRKEKRKEIERYDVRKIVSDKPRPVRDEFGRDVSVNRSRSRTRSRSVSYSGRRRSKGTTRRSFSQDDRWIDWSPVWNQQRRSRSRTRRSKSRSRNRSRLSGDRYRNRSKNRDRDREYDTREPRKRKRSISSEIDKYTPPMAELKKRRRSQDRSRKSGSYTGAPIRPSGRERDIPSEYYYERSRSWSRSLSYASLTPDQEQYVRYSRSPSIIEPPTRIPIVSPNRGHDMITPNQQNLTVIVPNVDLSKKKHKKKKESKKKKKKQPSKEVFTSGDNIVVSVNFDDNQKIISAKSSKRKHDEEKGRKKKKDETRKKRKQTLQVSEEVLNAKPVAVIDLNSSPCKEMSPTEVISLTDSGDDEVNVIENIIPADRRVASSQDDANKTPTERRAYVMTQSGPKTPPEPPIKFTVNSTAPSRPLPTNPIFEQDEIDGEDAMHYNKGPNTPPEPANQTRRSISPSTTMYDPFEPTKSRSQSPENAEYDERKDTATGTAAEERRPVIDMFSEDNDKSSAENQSGGVCAEKSKPQEDVAKENVTATPTKASASEDSALSTNTKSPAKDASAADSANETAQANGVNTLVLDLSSLGDDFVPKSTIPLVKTSQGKYEFQSGKAPDKPITVVISQQSQPAKPQPQQVMVTPTRQVPTKPVEPMKQPVFPDLLSWKLPPPLSQANFSTPPPTSSSLPLGSLVTPSKSAPGLLAQNGNQDENSFEVDDSPYSPASSEGDDLFEPPPLNASTSSPNKQRPSPMPAVNSYKSRVDALFSSSPIKKVPPRSNVPPHISKPVSAIKGTKKILKPPPPIPSSKKDPGIRADEEQLKILDDVPNSAVEMMVKEKFLKKLHRQERVVEEVKVVLKPHYAKKHITKEEYKDILRKAVPKICHNKSGDINPSKIQGLVQAYVKKIRHAKKKPTMGAGAPLFPPVKTGKTMKPQKTLWG